MFSLRVSWRYARGVISSDDSLFTRWDAPLLGRVVLDPVREEDAGKHTCMRTHRLTQTYWTWVRFQPPFPGDSAKVLFYFSF